MRSAPTRRPSRPAFTLIEMLVVIAIIAILVSLLMVAVMPVLLRGPELMNFNDIKQFDVALENWRSKYGTTFSPPSQMFLSNSLSDFQGHPVGDIHTVSLQYINTLWPHLNWNAKPPINWVDPSIGHIPKGGVILAGDQCLVFFLGGIPAKDNSGNPYCSGFSTSSSNPTAPGGPRVGPFYEFQGGRLVQRLGAAHNPFLSYTDEWSLGQPYLYFSSNKSRNSYTTADAITIKNHSSKSAPTVTVGPYYSATAGGGKNLQYLYLNPSTWQIISAGKDGNFGGTPSPPPHPHAADYPRLLWNPAAGATQADMLDDQTNFSDRPLAVAQ